MATVESTALAQNVAIHVVKVADRYYLVGGGSAGVALLAVVQLRRRAGKVATIQS